MLFFVLQLNATSYFFNPDRFCIFDHDSDFSVIQRPNQLDQLLFRLGQYKAVG